MVNINTLPDLCLLRVFHYLPLLDQLRLNKVCTRWRSLQLSVTRARKSLTLHVSPPGQDFSATDLFANLTCLKPLYLHLIESEETQHFYSTEECLYFTNFTQQSVNTLIADFPSISSLIILVKMTGFSEMDMFVQLLEHWSPTLTVLQFDARFEVSEESMMELKEACAKQIFQFFDCLNVYCTQLEVLNFYLYDRLYGLFLIPGYRETHEYVKLDLKFLSWIKEFYFSSYDHDGIIFDSLKQYAPGNGRLESIYLGTAYCYVDFVTHFRHLPNLCGKFKTLTEYIPQRSSLHFPDFMATFTELTSIRLEFTADLIALTTYLAPLKHLIHLSVNMFLEPEVDGDRTLRDSDELHSYQLHQLPSVKVFSPRVFSPKVEHTETESRHWSWIFPSLQVLELSRNNWNNWDEEYEQHKAQWNLEESVESMKKLLCPFKQCTGLKYILTIDRYSPDSTGERKEWSLEEFRDI